jgi:hypothetical protein
MNVDFLSALVRARPRPVLSFCLAQYSVPQFLIQKTLQECVIRAAVEHHHLLPNVLDERDQFGATVFGADLLNEDMRLALRNVNIHNYQFGSVLVGNLERYLWSVCKCCDLHSRDGAQKSMQRGPQDAWFCHDKGMN